MFETRFTDILRTLQTRLGNRVVRHDLYGPLLALMWNRISGMVRRFERLVARWRAGTLPRPRPARLRPPRPAAEAEALKPPRTRGWLVALCQDPAAIAAGQLRSLMTDEELRRFLADCPNAGRILRPLAHMLGVHPGEPEFAPIRLPPRPRRPRPPRPRKPREDLSDLRPIAIRFIPPKDRRRLRRLGLRFKTEP